MNILQLKTNNIQSEAKSSKHSIRTRFFLFFTGLALLIMILIWGLLIALLKPNYISSKKAGLISLADDIESIYNTDGFRNNADRLSFESNTETLIFDLVYQRYVYSTASLVTSRYVDRFPTIIDETIKNIEGRQLFKLEFTDIDAEMYIYGRVIDNNRAVLILLTSIDPIDSTTVILAKQFVLITLIVLLLAMGLSFVLARKLSNPIRSIASAAKNIATDGYDKDKADTGGFAELELLSKSLDYASDEIAQVQNLRRELIANTSHDLRTPLTMIKAYAEMIRDLSGDNPEKREEHLNVIITEADRLTRLVGDLLELSRLESDFTQLEIEDTSLSECIDETVRKFDLIRETQGYIFEVNIGGDFIVEADKFRLTQVLYNLISNAVAHVGVDKKVVVTLFSESADHCRVEITDHGVGIPKEELPHIWERYYRTAESHKRSHIGTGLGLSIVKNILTAHGSEFGVSSTVGKGTTFFFKMKLSNKIINMPEV